MVPNHKYTTPPALDESKFVRLSWLQLIWMNLKLAVAIPLVIIYEVILSPFVARSKNKSLKRVIGDTPFRFLTDHCTGPELQHILGTSVGVYSTWARKENLPITIEELEDGGKLMWIGPKNTEKMLLYCHGGAYVFAVQIFTISFWRYIQLQLEQRGLKVGIAIMSYSESSLHLALVPVSQFPTPLWQTSRALQHLLAVEKVDPSNLVLVGDSAGGNLISQVLSSMLHPLFSPPIIPGGIRLRGAYMMSPWFSLTGVCSSEDGGESKYIEDGRGPQDLLPSFIRNDQYDIIGKQCLLTWGRIVLDGAPDHSNDLPYLDPLVYSPDDWYRGLPEVVERVFVSTGGSECLRDADVLFFEKIKAHHGEAEFFEHKGGVHDDPFFDFNVADGPLGNRQSLTPRILEWVWECFEERQ